MTRHRRFGGFISRLAVDFTVFGGSVTVFVYVSQQFAIVDCISIRKCAVRLKRLACLALSSAAHTNKEVTVTLDYNHIRRLQESTA